MAVESATYVNQLNETLPTNTDPISEGDNHLRLIKQVLKNTFPNVGGQVTLNEADLNNAAIRSAALTSGALVKADASGKLTSSYAEADVPRRNQAETITGGWTFDTGRTRFRDQGAAAGPVVEIVGDDQVLWALEIKNATYGGNGLGLQQQDAGDFVLQLRDSTNSNTAALILRQDSSVTISMSGPGLVGRSSAGAGQSEYIQPSTRLSLSSGILDLGSVSAGDYSIAPPTHTPRPTTTSTTPTKMYEAKCSRPGSVRVRFLLSNSTTSGATFYGRVYVDGSPVGPTRSASPGTTVVFQDDVSVQAGSLVQVYAWFSATSTGPGGVEACVGVSDPYVGGTRLDYLIRT